MRFVVKNRKREPLEVVIEPWASVETIEPDARVIFEYPDENDGGEPQLEIVTQEDGSLLVGVNCDQISWIANGRETRYGP